MSNRRPDPGFGRIPLVLFFMAVVLLMMLVTRTFASESCPADKPIMKKTLALGGVVSCTAALCAKLVCPQEGVWSLTLDGTSNQPLHADCYYTQGNCNKCSYPEPVSICLSEDELNNARNEAPR